MSLLPGETLDDDFTTVKAGDSVFRQGQTYAVVKVDRRHGGTIYIRLNQGPLLAYDMRGNRRGSGHIWSRDVILLPTPARVRAARLRTLPSEIATAVQAVVQAGDLARLEAALDLLLRTDKP